VAGPVIAGLADDLVATELAVVLSDAEGRIIDRRTNGSQGTRRLDRMSLAPGFSWSESHAGTNGIGTAIAERSAVLVAEEENFAHSLTGLTSAAVVVTDPRSATVLGAVALVCTVNVDRALLLAITKRAGRDVEQRLVDGPSAVQRLLHEQFLRARRRGRKPLVLIAPDVLLTNTAAARMFVPTDHRRLWHDVEHELVTVGENAASFTASDGTTFVATCEPIHDGGLLVGALLRVSGPADRVATRRRSRRATVRRPTFGWVSLTATERGIAHLVANGLTNREVAVRQLVSPHTVDSHLRHIFSKLGISSRLDLARLVMQREATCDSHPAGLAERA
jgi:transcriptional regulator of acetoin/glycerol metabolism/DNA-binding CsgD family transcriptional regulator